MKSSVPFGELPALEVDLQLYSGVEPILRYVAQLAGFCPTDPIEVLEADMLLKAVEDFRRCPKPMIPNPTDEEPGQEMRGLMRGVRGLGRPPRRGGRGMRRGRGMRHLVDDESGGFGPVRRQRRRHGLDPMSGERKNPFDLKEEENTPGNLILGNHLLENHRQLRKIKKAKDYLIGFSRHLENSLDGAEFLVGSNLSYADFSLFAELRTHLTAQPEFLKHFPTLQNWHNSLANAQPFSNFMN
ncbi:uncharacterized protein LOC134815644 [Bolinopsis microptera]|uniref:uncharacterized protein LOC134815644 n=1 Tax=Bolinopsis microptera TaxID=2820187 RepID=UPI00307981D1